MAKRQIRELSRVQSSPALLRSAKQILAHFEEHHRVRAEKRTIMIGVQKGYDVATTESMIN
jgi:hypothetical protein